MIRANPLVLLAAVAAAPVAAAPVFTFDPGELVVSVEGAGVWGAVAGSYLDNQASPMTLFQFKESGTTSAAYDGALVLPQTASGANAAFSAEYGSSSEGTLQLSGDGRYLTVMGYGVNAAAFNANPTAYGTAVNAPTKPNALAQSLSVPTAGYITVPRVVALVGADGSVDTSTALTGVFNGNNPRSAYTADGSSFYVSGQGTSPDSTGGVFLAKRGAATATPITGNDTNSNASSQDTRDVQVVNGRLYVSADSKAGSGSNRDFVGTLGAGSPPTTTVGGPTMLPGFGASGGSGKVTITAATANGVNAAGQEINLSPEGFFFANATTLYVDDSGAPKNNSAATKFGDGGLQKWTFDGANWTLDYTLSAGLGLVSNAAAAGTTGLLGLTGQVTGGLVNLYATSYTVGDTDPSFLFGITDVLSATTMPAGETFATLAAAPADSTFKGVAFAPAASAVPEPATWASMVVGLAVAGGAVRRRPVRRARAA